MAWRTRSLAIFLPLALALGTVTWLTERSADAALTSCAQGIQLADAAVTGAYGSFVESEGLYAEAQGFYQQILASPAATAAQKSQAFALVQAADQNNAQLQSQYFTVFTIANTQLNPAVQADPTFDPNGTPGCAASTLAAVQGFYDQILALINGSAAGTQPIATLKGAVNLKRNELKALLDSLGGNAKTIFTDALGVRVDERAVNKLEPGVVMWMKDKAAQFAQSKVGWNLPTFALGTVKEAWVDGSPTVDLGFEEPGFNGSGPAGAITGTLSWPGLALWLKTKHCSYKVEFDNFSISFQLNMTAGVNSGVDLELTKLSTPNIDGNIWGGGFCGIAASVAETITNSVMDGLLGIVSTTVSGGAISIVPTGGMNNFKLVLNHTVTESELNGLFGFSAGSDPVEKLLNDGAKSALLDKLSPFWPRNDPQVPVTATATMSSMASDANGLKATFDITLSEPKTVSAAFVPPASSMQQVLAQRNINGQAGTLLDGSIFISPELLSAVGWVPGNASFLLPGYQLPSPFSLSLSWALGNVPGGNDYWSAYAVLN